MNDHFRHSPDSGFEISSGRAGIRRRMFDVLRPQGGFIPLDIDLIDIIAELDPGMIDWKSTSLEGRHRQGSPASSWVFKSSS